MRDRANPRARVHAEFAKRSDAADRAVLHKMAMARINGVAEKSLFKDAAVAEAEIARAAALRDLIGASIACGVSIFGDEPSEHNFWPCPKPEPQHDR